MDYKVSELAEKAGVTKRTIHFYISKGLLLPPKGSGINSLYDDTHLERLLLIKKLQAEFLPLSKIREYILQNPEAKADTKIEKEKIYIPEPKDGLYVKEDICGLFELHCSYENSEKYKHIIENVKHYVEKLLED